MWGMENWMRGIYLYLSARTRPFFRYPLGGLPQAVPCVAVQITRPGPGVDRTHQRPPQWLLLAL